MIDLLLPNPPTKFAEYVYVWSKQDFMELRAYSIHTEKTSPDIKYNCKPSRFVKGNSFTLGAYSPNVIGTKHYD